MRNVVMLGGVVAVMLAGNVVAAEIGEPAMEMDTPVPTSSLDPMPIEQVSSSTTATISSGAAALASSTSTASKILMNNTTAAAEAAKTPAAPATPAMPATDDEMAGHDMGAMAMPAVDDKTPPSTKALMEANAKMHAGMNAPMIGDADVDFVRGMIPHHQGAIDMAKAELAYGKDPDIKMLANDIIKAQNKEIEMMQNWLALHGPKDAKASVKAPAVAKPKPPVVKAVPKAKPIGELLKDAAPALAATAVTPTTLISATTVVTTVETTKAVGAITSTSAVVEKSVEKTVEKTTDKPMDKALPAADSKLIPDDEMEMPLLDGMDGSPSSK